MLIGGVYVRIKLGEQKHIALYRLVPTSVKLGTRYECKFLLLLSSSAASLCRKCWYRVWLNEVSRQSCFSMSWGQKENTHFPWNTFHTVHTFFLSAPHLVHHPSSFIHERIQLLFHLHTHTHSQSHTQTHMARLNGVWSVLTSPRGALICMLAVFSSIPRPIIIINPDWGIGTPNLTGLYGYSHSRWTGVTLYYILFLPDIPCVSLIVKKRRLMTWGTLFLSEIVWIIFDTYRSLGEIRRGIGKKMKWTKNKWTQTPNETEGLIRTGIIMWNKNLNVALFITA